MDIRDHIRDIPDFPKPGILFKDITPIMQDPAAFRSAVHQLRDLVAGVECDAYGAIESRGFLFGTPLSLHNQKPLVLLRKQGKLPADTWSVTYSLEYGEATLEMHKDAIKPGDRVLIVDDLLATGGTAVASAELVRLAGGVVAGFGFVVELEFLSGRAALEPLGPVFSLVKYGPK